MKRTIILGLAASMLLSTSAGAADLSNARKISGSIHVISSQNLQDMLAELNDRYGDLFEWIAQQRPGCPELPDDSETPDTPDESETPDVPDEPGTPDAPETPDIPELPDLPDIPDLPAVPDTPVIPEIPDEPALPDETPGVDASMSAYAQEVVRLVNVERAKNGLSALTVNAKATQAAQVRAAEQAKSFSHTRPNGTSCFTALKEAGVSYRSAGENIAYGQRTPEAVVNAWMNSAGHRANILGSQFTEIGVGYTVINGTPYWSQFFIG